MDRLRFLRRQFPPLGDLDEVGWELVRELVCAEARSQQLSVSALSLSVEQVSASTALRRIQDLARAGIVTRTPDSVDARREFVSLPPTIRATLHEYFKQVAREFATIARLA